MATVRTLVIIPTYNERENIVQLLREIRALGMAELDRLVVDDASPDGTAALVSEEATQDRHIFLLNRERKRGIGSASIEGFQWGISRGYEALLTMDADLSHDPREVPVMLRELQRGADVVVGSRRIPGAKIIGWNLWRRFTSRSANWFARALLSIPVSDVTSGYRAYRASVLQKIDLGCIRTDGYAFQEELMWHLARRRAIAIKEVPIIFRDRERGESKLGAGEVVAFFAAMARLSSRQLLPPAILGLGVFALYAGMASRTIFPGDSTEFIAVVGGNGVAHPPGYPLYTLLGHLTRAFPWGELVFRMNLLSAIFSTATVVTVYALGRSLTRSTTAAIFGALTLALTPVFFLYALVAEVFTLHAFLLSLILYTALRFAERPSRKLLLGGALLFGIGMANHHTTLFLAPVLAALLWTRRKRIPKFWLRLGEAAGAIVLGLTPYLAIPLFARGNPVINWDSATNLQNLTRLFLRSDYGTTTLAPAALSFTPHTYAIHEFARFFFTHGFGILALLSAIGLGYLFRTRRRSEAWMLFGAALFLGPVFAVIARTAMVSVNQAAAFERFLIAPLVPLAILAGIGAAAVIAAMRARSRLRPLAWVALFALSLPFAIQLARAPSVNQRDMTLYAELTREQVNLLPPSAVYLTTDELSDMATDYWQITQSERPDVRKIAITKLPGAWYRDQVRARFPELAPLIVDSLDETITRLCDRFAPEGLLFAASWPNRLAGTSEHCAALQDRLLVRVWSPDVQFDLEQYKKAQDDFWAGFSSRIALPSSANVPLRIRRVLQTLAEMRHRTGKMYRHAGFTSWARDEFERASAISGDWDESMLEIAALDAEAGDYEQALVRAKEAMRRSPEDLWAYYAAGVYALRLEDTRTGERFLQQFLSFKPSEKFSETGRAKELLKAVRQSLTNSP
ncbi:MAG: DUF2723 domain-containing protein [Patescibacteria group bacterium]